MEGCFMFQWGWGVVFQMGGAPWVGTSILVGGGGGFEKNRKMWGGDAPTMGNPGEWSH